MSKSKHDYTLLEREYIESDISVRALAERHGASWSPVNLQKNKREWDRKRADYQHRMEGRQIEALVDNQLRTVEAIHSELLMAVRSAVRRFIADVQRETNPQPVSARDLMGLIDKFLLLTGQATSRSETKNLDLHAIGDFGGILAGAPPELLRELADVARTNGAGAKQVGRGPLVVLEGVVAS